MPCGIFKFPASLKRWKIKNILWGRRKGTSSQQNISIQTSSASAANQETQSVMEETTSIQSLPMPSALSYLPFNLIVEILCRLPVKFLLQLCCVCKSWNSLILKDHKFAKKHLRMSTKHQHLVTTRWMLSKEFSIISYPLHSNIPLHSILTSKGTRLDYSLAVPNYLHNLVASCDGLFCFSFNRHLVYIYNPCIRKLKKLPDIDRPRVSPYRRYAFGYDPFIDNYKVIVVFCYDNKSEVSVHTLGSDSWRRIKNLPSKYPLGPRGIFISGTVNWLTHYSNGLTGIVSLHLGKESYQDIPLPDCGHFVRLTLDETRDCLCIFSEETRDSSTYVWLMKEYGNKDSWTKLICLPYFGDSGYFCTEIMYISEDNNHVLLVVEGHRKFKWVVYDCKNDTIVSSKIEDLSRVESKVYVESLISP